MSGLDQLYQQIILDHAKAKHGFGLRDAGPGAASADSHQYNPLCGDEVTLRAVVTTASDGTAAPVVADVAWTGEGCSISQASTSVLHELVVGRPVPEATGLVEEFRTMIRSRGQVEPDEEVLGDAAAFAGVGRHANRVKCAMLGWTAFEDALSRAVADLFEASPQAGPPAVSTTTEQENA
ncbi:MAG: SUF system NifU family Fe-S cluster assembly protein [Actinobacteria bacterium]|nr:SUF system NifU family Fe-S cluster assembly protein [Actinomycetota bacterium]